MASALAHLVRAAPVAAAIAGACALSTSSEPGPEPVDTSSANEPGGPGDGDGVDDGEGDAGDDAGAGVDASAPEPPQPPEPPSPGEVPAPASRCARTPRAHEVPIDDASVLVTVYEECRPGPERDLGDPPPGP